LNRVIYLSAQLKSLRENDSTGSKAVRERGKEKIINNSRSPFPLASSSSSSSSSSYYYYSYSLFLCLIPLTGTVRD